MISSDLVFTALPGDKEGPVASFYRLKNEGPWRLK